MDYLLIELILWIVVISFLVMCFGLFMHKAAKDEMKSSKQFFFCVAFFFLSTGAQRGLSLILDFFLTDFMFLLFFITLLNLISIIPLLFHLENSVLKTKRIISIISIIMIIIYCIAYLFIGSDSDSDRELMNFFFLPSLILGMGATLYIYLYLFIKSSGEIRKNALFILVGIFTILASWIIHSYFGRASPTPDPNLIDIIGIICPIGYTIGLALLTLGFLRRNI